MSHHDSDDLDFQETVARHLDSLFRGILAGEKVWNIAPSGTHTAGKEWSPVLQDDLCKAAKVLAAAWQFPVKLDWDAEDLRASISKKPTGFNQRVENDLLDIFKPFSTVSDVLEDRLPVLHRPGIVVDSEGRILVWALPGILSKTRQNLVLIATEHLKSDLRVDRSKPADPARLHVGWRTGPAFFGDGRDWPAGSWLATPAGYALGHQTTMYPALPSPCLSSQSGKDWMRDMRETGALLSAILKVAHPQLFEAGRESLRRASAHPAAQSAICAWPGVFNKVQLISNRQSPYHRDTSGRATWYDLLVTLGTYKWATLSLRNVGVQVAYRPGTVALISALLIHHGAAEVKPDRLCYSWFMSDDLHRNLKVPEVDWMYREFYCPYCSTLPA